MKKLFALTIVVVFVISSVFVGCASHSSADDELADPRFECIYFTNVTGYACVEVLRDKETGVEYLFVTDNYRGGLCPLYDENGTVIVSERSDK